MYVLRRDPAWFIRACKGSKQWYVFHGTSRDTATRVSPVQPTLTAAMALLLTSIEGGFYVIDNEEDD